MNFVYKGVIIYITYILILVIIDVLLGNEMKIPDLHSQMYGLIVITWIGIDQILETPILHADMVMKKWFGG